eukprot:7385894-Prymnesium_polylepis.1
MGAMGGMPPMGGMGGMPAATPAAPAPAADPFANLAFKCVFGGCDAARVHGERAGRQLGFRQSAKGSCARARFWLGLFFEVRA